MAAMVVEVDPKASPLTVTGPSRPYQALYAAGQAMVVSVMLIYSVV